VIILCFLDSTFWNLGVQVLLTDYLDFKASSTLGSLTGQQQNNPASFSEPTADINSYFVRLVKPL
jgi:hypothetical protein